MEVGNITKAAASKSFLHLSYKNTQLLLFVTVLFNIFTRQILSGYDKNFSCAGHSLKNLNKAINFDLSNFVQ